MLFVYESFLLMFCSNSLGVGSDICGELSNFYGSIIPLWIMFFFFFIINVHRIISVMI